MNLEDILILSAINKMNQECNWIYVITRNGSKWSIEVLKKLEGIIQVEYETVSTNSKISNPWAWKSLTILSNNYNLWNYLNFKQHLANPITILNCYKQYIEEEL